MTHDGLGKYLSQVVEKAPGDTDDVVGILRETGTDVVVNYLPVGSEEATKWYTEQILQAGCAMVNCMPVFIAKGGHFQRRFEDAGLPIIGDDIKSQVGATITHRVLTTLFRERGVRLDKTMQLNVGGNSDFLNMLERERLESKKISKTNAVTAMLDYDIGERERPRRPLRLRAVAHRPQVGLHPDGGLLVRRRAAQHRAQARGLGLAELGRDRHRRGAAGQAGAEQRRRRRARRPERVPDEVAAEAGRRTTTRTPQSSASSSSTRARRPRPREGVTRRAPRRELAPAGRARGPVQLGVRGLLRSRCGSTRRRCGSWRVRSTSTSTPGWSRSSGEASVGLVNLGVRGERGWIGGLGVVPSARRRGVGRDLMEAVHDQARARGIRRISLEVIEANEPAFRLYEELGYEMTRWLEIGSLDGNGESGSADEQHVGGGARAYPRTPQPAGAVAARRRNAQALRRPPRPDHRNRRRGLPRLRKRRDAHAVRGRRRGGGTGARVASARGRRQPVQRPRGRPASHGRKGSRRTNHAPPARDGHTT